MDHEDHPETTDEQREEKQARDEEMKHRQEKMAKQARDEEMTQRPKNAEWINRAILCGVTAVVTWKFASTRTRRQAVKTVYALGRQAGEREAELEQVIVDHVNFLDRYHLLPLFKKSMGYQVEIGSE